MILLLLFLFLFVAPTLQLPQALGSNGSTIISLAKPTNVSRSPTPLMTAGMGSSLLNRVTLNREMVKTPPSTPILISKSDTNATFPPKATSSDDDLSPYLIPLSYDISIKLPLAQQYNGFSASLVLLFNLTDTTDTVVLHSVDLHSFRNITLISTDDLFEPTLRSIRILKSQVEFRFGRLLSAGSYLLTIGEYNGRLGNSSTGLFHRKRDLYTTHLQPSFARTVLPCVDHPAVKAVFRVSVVHPTDTVAQSNTIANDVHVVDVQWQKTIFAPTPPLPAYLLAFSVMSDTHIQLARQTSFGVTIRVNAKSHKVAIRVLDIALTSFERLATMLEVPLPLNKIDIVLVPDYDGGMENWGHILLSESLASTGDDAHLMYVVAHELAHHWIGDRATIDSWQYICLQEDITDLLAYKIVKSLLGDDDRYARFRLAKYVEIQLAEDFLSPGHSLLMPENIDHNMISTHCYLKGVILLESLESVVSEEYMLAVIRNLVVFKSSFNLTVFAAHFDEIKIEGDVSLSRIYEFWFTQGGFPTILVDKDSVSQQSEMLWPIRLASAVSLPQFLFAKSITYAKQQAPLIVNLNFTSFVRVNYDPETWTDIFSYMNEDPTLFSPVGRAQLVTDFCYFQANNKVENGSAIRTQVIDMVYSRPEAFDLCDWNLYWCHASTDVAFFTSLLRRLAVGFSGMFDSDSAFGCRNGHAVRNVNAFCEGLFGRKCI